MYKGIIFDLDGTLLDTIRDLSGSVNAALRALGYPEHTPEEYKKLVGNGFSVLMMRALPEEARTEEIQAEMLRHFTADYHERFMATTVPYEGIPEMLAALSAKGIPLAVNSNKRDSYTKALIEKHFPDIPFAMVLGGKDEIPHKPDPASALLCARAMGVPAPDAVCVGDSGIDIVTAKNAGMGSVGVLWGFREEEELAGAGADHIAADPASLGRILGL